MHIIFVAEINRYYLCLQRVYLGYQAFLDQGGGDIGENLSVLQFLQWWSELGEDRLKII